MDLVNTLYKLILIFSFAISQAQGTNLRIVSNQKPETASMTIEVDGTYASDSSVTMTVDGLQAPCAMNANFRRVCKTSWLSPGQHTVLTQSYLPTTLTVREYVWGTCIFIPSIMNGTYAGPSQNGLPFGEVIETPVPVD